jgi:hypothetical protein
MSQSSLRNNDGNPFLYLETTTGSTAIGTDTTGADDIVKIVTGLVSNIEPTSAAGSIAIETTTPGNIEFRPNGIGQSNFVNGDVSISADNGLGNLNMEDTIVGGDAGVITYGGTRFIHNYGGSNNNIFVGENAGNFSTVSTNNIGIGTNALLAVTNGASNVCIGTSSGDSITSGASNCSMGNSSLSALQNGFSNVAIGSQSLSLCTSGSSNTVVGLSAGIALLSGSSNTLIGANAGSSYTGAESSNIAIKDAGTIGDNNTIRIGTQGAGAGQQNQCFIAGINGVSVTAAGTVVIDASGQLGSSSAMSTIWSEVTGVSQGAAANAGYIANNAGTVTITLIAAASASIGTTLRVTGINNATGWAIAQNASQQIFFGNTSTTAGVGGSLASTATRDSVELVCVSANGLLWNVISSVGNITVT